MAQERVARATSDSLLAAAAQVMAGIAGPDARPREDQLAAAHALAVDGRRALVVQATGWGKSAVYWMATRALRDAGAGTTLVISPLLALMRDQVDAARRSGLRAVTINSANAGDWAAIHDSLASGRVDLLLTSPERLATPRFASQVLPWLLPSLGLLVIDEAHCISSWGHDFRPDYRRISTLLTQRPDLPVLATTATANNRVTADVSEQLGDGTILLRGTLARESLHLSTTGTLSVLEAFAWVDGALPTLPGSGIVYVATPQRAQDLASFLGERGHVVRAYHGKLEPDQRLEVEEDLRDNRLKAVIATSALGMGYDKPDLGFVVHVGSPASPVDYYQQVGRAGRALDTAVVVLIPTPEDHRLWQYFATATIPREEEAMGVLALLEGAPGAMQIAAVSIETGISESRLEFMLKVLAVEGAVERTGEGWVPTGQPWHYDRDRYDALLAAREHEARLMKAYARSDRCLDSVLREALDDPATRECGRCSVCTGSMPGALAPQPEPDSVVAARAFLRGIDVVLVPRKMWTSGLQRRGSIRPAQRCDEGRALAFAVDPGWPEVQPLLDQPDQPAPDWLVEAMVGVLDRWRTRWPARPHVIVPVPSTRRPLLIGSLAHRLADVTGVSVATAIAIGGMPSDTSLSTKSRAAFQERRIERAPGVQVQGHTVLLLDDEVKTGWTLTFAGALLREAGAEHVLPLVVSKQPVG